MANRKTQSKAVNHLNLVSLKSDITADEFDALSLTLCKAKGLTDLLNTAAYSEVVEQLYDDTLPTVLGMLLDHIEDAEKLTEKLNQRLRPPAS